MHQHRCKQSCRQTTDRVTVLCNFHWGWGQDWATWGEHRRLDSDLAAVWLCWCHNVTKKCPCVGVCVSCRRTPPGKTARDSRRPHFGSKRRSMAARSSDVSVFLSGWSAALFRSGLKCSCRTVEAVCFEQSSAGRRCCHADRESLRNAAHALMVQSKSSSRGLLFSVLWSRVALFPPSFTQQTWRDPSLQCHGQENKPLPTQQDSSAEPWNRVVFCGCRAQSPCQVKL